MTEKKKAPKSKSEMMNRKYAEYRAKGYIRLSFWVPEEMRQGVTEAVERILEKKKKFWESLR